MNNSCFLSQLRRCRYLLLLLASLLISLILLDSTKVLTEKDCYDQMLDAAQRTEAAFSAVREARLSSGEPISPLEDPNSTGLIGLSYSDITTTLGSLEAKRSSTNPNVAAMIVDMLVQCGVEPGDRVAVNFSGSFPGLNIASICALEALGAEPIIISSVGASTYGANLPGLTYQDMEKLLFEQKLISHRSTAFSLGGAGDLGKEMPPEVKAAIIARHRAGGLNYLEYADLDENVAARRAIYEAEGAPVCLLNAGGNLLSFGGGTEMVHAKNGIINPSLKRDSGSGLIPLYHNQGVPVIHLLNMKALLKHYGLPFDPSPLPAAGEGGVYFRTQYSTPLMVVLAAVNLGLFVLAARHREKEGLPLHSAFTREKIEPRL